MAVKYYCKFLVEKSYQIQMIYWCFMNHFINKVFTFYVFKIKLGIVVLNKS
jgi:hypothetical protein